MPETNAARKIAVPVLATGTMSSSTFSKSVDTGTSRPVTAGPFAIKGT